MAHAYLQDALLVDYWTIGSSVLGLFHAMLNFWVTNSQFLEFFPHLIYIDDIVVPVLFPRSPTTKEPKLSFSPWLWIRINIIIKS